MKIRCDELQKLESQVGRAITGNFRTTNLGVVMAESGLRPAKSLLNNRSRHHVLRLMSLPKGDKAKSPPGCGATDGPLQRVLRTGGRDIPAVGRTNGTRRQHFHRRRGVGGVGGEESGPPTGAGALDGRVSGQEWSGGVRGGVEEGTELGREKDPHGILSGGIRRDCAAVAAARASSAESASLLTHKPRSRG